MALNLLSHFVPSSTLMRFAPQFFNVISIVPSRCMSKKKKKSKKGEICFDDKALGKDQFFCGCFEKIDESCPEPKKTKKDKKCKDPCKDDKCRSR